MQEVVGSIPIGSTTFPDSIQAFTGVTSKQKHSYRSACRTLAALRSKMATIVKRGNKFQVQVRRKGFATLYRSFHQKSDAMEWARHMEVKADRGDLPTSLKVMDQHKVRDILDRYLKEISSKKLSHDSEKYILRNLLKQPFASLSIAEITATKFCDYRDMRLKAVKSGTVRRELSLIKHAFDVAMREWSIPIKANPIDKITKLKPQAGRSRRLQDGEFIKLQAAIGKTTNRHVMPVIRFAIATAMRRGEILRLRWEDVDFNTSTLHIPFAKNGHARTIPLSSYALSVLREVKEKAAKDEKRVFPMAANAFQLAWQRLVARSGIEDLHFHDLRHEAISRFVEKGLSVPEVALISGHRDYRMLFKYTHLKPETLVKKLN